MQLARAGKVEEAVAQMQAAARLDSTSADISRELARLLLESHRPADAIIPARRATVLDSTNAEAHWLLGQSLLEESKLDEAIVSLRRALDMDRNHRNYTVSLLMALDLSGRTEEALRLLQPAMGGSEPDTPYLFLKRGELEEKLGRVRDALADYLRTMQLAPGYPDAPTRIVAACRRLGASDTTVAACSTALQLDPKRSEIRRMLAQLLVNLGKDEEAVPHLQQLYAEDSLDAPVIMQLGVIRFRKGDAREAIPLLRKARKIDPTIPDVNVWLWRSLDRADSLDAALHIAEEMVGASSGARQGHWFRAVSLSRLRRYADAKTELDLVERLSPGDRDAALLSAMILAEQGDLDGARSRISAVLKVTPNDHEALYRLAQVEQRAGNSNAAIDLFQRLIEADPKDASALNDAGYLCAELGIRLEDALEWTKRAVSLDGSNPAYLDSYGWALFRLGRYSEAVIQLQEAAKRGPEAEIRIHLAQALRAAGRSDDGRQILREVLAEQPTQEKARQLLEKWTESKPGGGNRR